MKATTDQKSNPGKKLPKAALRKTGLRAESVPFDIGDEGDLPEDAASKQETRALFGDAARTEETKQAFHIVFLWFLRVALVCLILLFVVRILHLILPENWRWLCNDDVSALDKFLFSGTLGGLIVQYMKQIVPSGKLTKVDD